MVQYAVTPPPQATVKIQNSDALFPIRRVYCIGRNYADHAIEMGHDPEREPPFFFQKNPHNIVGGDTFPYPQKSNDVHHEIEMVVALRSGGCNIAVDDAMHHVFGYAVGLDMTRRDLQSDMKKRGRPWEIAKAFEYSAPTSEIVPAENVSNPHAGVIQLTVNGEIRQQGNLNQMIWKIPEMIAYLSQYYELATGDLIMSGTPAGVGAIKRGDVMVGSIDGIGEIEITVV